MAIKNIIVKGIGFNPGSVSFIPTHGFSIGEGPTGTTIFKFGKGSRLSKKNDKAQLEVK